MQVEYARTVSKSFQSVKFGVTIEFEPPITASQATALAMFMVKVGITKEYTAEEVMKHQDCYRACFHEPIEAFLYTIKPREAVAGELV